MNAGVPTIDLAVDSIQSCTHTRCDHKYLFSFVFTPENLLAPAEHSKHLEQSSGYLLPEPHLGVTKVTQLEQWRLIRGIYQAIF